MNENEKPKKKGWKYKIKPLSVKKQAVELFLKGETPLAELGKQFGVNPNVISLKWVKQVERGKDRLMGGYKMPTNKTRLKVVKEIISGAMTIEQAMSQYDIVTEETIHKWIKKFSSQIVTNNHGPLLMTPPDTKPGPKPKVGSDARQFLDKSLEEARLKIIALETMITIAEEQFKIDIRKKYGTKQLE